MGERLGESLQAEWNNDPFASELWDALERGEAEPGKAMLLVDGLAQKGSPMAMLNLAEIYAYGMWGRDRDFALAIDWSRRAAHAGSTEGKFLLSRLLEGEGEIELARNLLNEMADEGFPIAMWTLGNWYYKGDHLPRDPIRAKGYFEAAWKLGHIPSKTWLNHMLKCGEFGALRRIEGIYKSATLLPTVYRQLHTYPESDRLRR